MRTAFTKTLISSALAILFAQSTQAQGFNSLSLGQQNLQQLKDCLEYTIHGITLRVIITPFGYYYFWTPNVSHFSPDMLSMSHPELNEMPYTEYGRIFGGSLKQVSNVGFSKMLGAATGLGSNLEIGGGRYQHEAWGKHQSVQFSENSVIGNPSAMIIDAFTWDGLNVPNTEQSGHEVSGEESTKYLQDFSEGKAEWSDNFNQAFQYNMVMQTLASSPVIQQIKMLVQQIDSSVSAFNGRVGDSPFCPVNQQAFQPFFLSGIDVYNWRMGYPITDSDKITNVANPLEESIGKDGDIWGYLYPREGAVNHQERQKVAAVVAARSADILANGGSARIYKQPQYKMDKLAWSSVYPKTSTCHRKIPNTVSATDEKGQYAWTLWTNHRCDLYRRGIVVAFIPIGPIHITPEITN